jgi:hypothetical protein
MTLLTSSSTAARHGAREGDAADRNRRAALLLVAGAVATILSGVVVQAIVMPTTDVADDRWSYPWSPTALVAVSILYTAVHVLVIVGLLGVRRREPTGPSRWGRLGVDGAIAGTALLAVGELASILVRHAATDDAGAMIVGAVFGLGSVVSAVGFLAAGVAVARAGRWQAWRRWPMLATGLWLVALTGLAATKALPTAVALYGVGLLATGLALHTSPGRATSRTPDAARLVRG